MPNQDSLPHSWLYCVFHAWITLLTAGAALWHYQMGQFDRILLPAALSMALLTATLMSLGTPSARRAAAIITLLASYLLCAELIRNGQTPDILWLGFPPVLTTLLLSMRYAIYVNLLMAPVWLLLNGNGPSLIATLSYLAVSLAGALAQWEMMRQLTLDKLTSPHDPECDALSSDMIAERLPQEHKRANALGRRLSVLVIHLPQLEMAHEQFGARLRLELLQRFCQAARRSCRLDDTLGRTGESLLWMLLPGTDENDALMTRNRLLTMLNDTAISETGHLSAMVVACTLHPGESLSAFEQRLRIKERALVDSTP
ncbi:MAG: diguanylate cyclase [Halomonadaceae bacterium]|nr:diguanylate cyclase [Halomonadaceae bacterium]